MKPILIVLAILLGATAVLAQSNPLFDPFYQSMGVAVPLTIAPPAPPYVPSPPPLSPPSVQYFIDARGHLQVAIPVGASGMYYLFSVEGK